MKRVPWKFVLPAAGVLVGVVVMVVLATQVVPSTLITLIKANQNNKASLSNSYMFGDKMVALADGKDTVSVNVFLLDSNNRPVSGVGVDVKGEGMIDPVGVPISDANGKATFSMTSTTEGQFVLQGFADGKPLNRTVKVTFRN